MPDKKIPSKLIPQREFFRRFNIDPMDYQCSGLKWGTLSAIYADYISWWDYLQPAAQFIANTLALEPGVHAVSHRVKDPEHLVEKIIRRSRRQESPWATLHNYKLVVRDLIGVRALHLFKEDWTTVDASIRRHWRPKGKPVANVRESDPEYVVDEFRKAGCKVEVREGYRSIHYEIGAQVSKNTISVELQVRTLVEEAWGEVSHQVEYPYFQGAELIQSFLIAMSETAGLGDKGLSRV